MQRTKSLTGSSLLYLTVVFLSFFGQAGEAMDLSKTIEQTVRPSLSEFDEDVAQCRREVRKYCAIVQKLMFESNPSRQEGDEALAYLRDAIPRWIAVRTKYQDSPPAEYRDAPRFRDQLTDVLNYLEDMQTHLAAGRYRRSYHACAAACGLFVAMHEENNLVYALDRLFHLRASARTATVAVRTGGLPALRDLLPDLMRLRDRVLLAPCPWPDDQNRRTAYQNSLRDLSAKLDEIAIRVGQQEEEGLSRDLRDLYDGIQKAYGLAL